MSDPVNKQIRPPPSTKTQATQLSAERLHGFVTAPSQERIIMGERTVSQPKREMADRTWEIDVVFYARGEKKSA